MNWRRLSSPDLQVFYEPPVLAIPCDPKRSRHQFADDGGDVVALLLFVHAVLRGRRRHDEVDHRSRCVELLGVLDRDAKFLLDAGEEFVERPAHDAYSSGGAPRRVSGSGSTDGLEYNRALSCFAELLNTSTVVAAGRTAYIAAEMSTRRKRGKAQSAVVDGADESPIDAPHGSRPEQVYARLRELIVGGLLAPGNRIVETEIASRLGVSRTPVREALQRLLQEGYVIDTLGAQQSRLTVAPLTRDDVHELLTLVGALEGIAAQHAASQRPDVRATLAKDLRDANAEFHRAGRASPIDHEALHDADERFHRRIVESGAGPRLLALYHAVKPQAERYIRMYISMLTGDIRSSVAEHDIIIGAITEGRCDDAESAVESNWRHAADRLSRVIEVAGERGSW